MVVQEACKCLLVNDFNSLFRALAYMDTKKELSPVEDRGLIVLVFNTPEGSSIEYTNNNSFVLEDLLAEVDESDKYFVIAGSPTVKKELTFFRPLPWENRERSVQEITSELNRKLGGLTGFAPSLFFHLHLVKELVLGLYKCATFLWLCRRNGDIGK